MQTRQMMSGMRRLGYVVVLAMGLTLVSTIPAQAERELTRAAVVCGTDELPGTDPWAAPPERGMPGEPY